MPLVLVRVDDRLLHGQVAHGWSGVLRAELYVVADDHAATSEWERETYEASAPEGAEARVLAIAEAAREAREGRFDRPRTVVLVRGPGELLALWRAGLAMQEVNVGGLHAGPGRESAGADLPGLYLTPAERAAFDEIIRAKIRCTYQPLPGDEARVVTASALRPGEGAARGEGERR